LVLGWGFRGRRI